MMRITTEATEIWSAVVRSLGELDFKGQPYSYEQLADLVVHRITEDAGDYDSDDFQKALTYLLNCHSMENGSNTPDFLLAEYMLTCLRAYEKITGQRDKWYGIAPIPGFPGYKLEDPK